MTHYTIWMVSSYAHKSIARKQKIKLGSARVLYNVQTHKPYYWLKSVQSVSCSTSKISRLVSQCITFTQSLNVEHFSSWLFLKNFFFLLKHIKRKSLWDFWQKLAALSKAEGYPSGDLWGLLSNIQLKKWATNAGSTKHLTQW